MKTEHTPLKIWIWVGSLFVLIQVIVLFIYNLKETEIDKPKNEHYFDQINFIKKDFENEISSYKVIIIGTSLIGNGVSCQDEIDEFLISKPKIKLSKIWGSNDLLKKFVANNLVSDIIKSKPDLVLFQTELATINFKEKNFLLDNMYELSSINKSVIRYLSPFTKSEKYSSEYRCYPRDIDIQTKTDTLTFTPAYRTIKNIANLDYLTNSLNQLNKAGIKSIIVDIPRPIESEKAVFNPSFTKAVQELLNIYKSQYGIKHWEYTGQPLYFKHCVDLAHLNKEGREIYTKWLLDKIEKEK